MNTDFIPQKTIFITGASSGIGASLAQLYANETTALFLCGRNAERLEKTAQLCRDKGAFVKVFAFDINDAQATMDAVKQANSIYKIDLVIANAGISSGILGIDEDMEATRMIMQTNIFGVMNTVLPAIKVMRQNGGGQIALMSSMAGYRGLRNCPAYSASKNCVKAWGEALRGFLEKDKIKVSVICPGFIKTPLTDANGFFMPFLMQPEKASKIIQKGLIKNKPIIAFPSIMVFLVWFGSILPSCLFHGILKLLPQKEK